uniref:F-box domain-containing protein n=1 Tax=Meloidogyne incognita TaxID=6306 RepID=A0A914LY16_MELIC
MLFNLSIEAKLDVLKCLNFYQLLSIRQTKRHFNDLFIRYENELARFHCKKLFILDKKRFVEIFVSWEELDNDYCLELEPNLDDFNFKLSDELKEKWEFLIGRQLCLNILLTDIYFVIKDNSMSQKVFFKISTSPKNIDDLLIIRYWMERLFSCVFEDAKLFKILFSHRFIKLLFFDYSIPPQFKIKNAFLKYYEPNFGMNFVLHNLAVCESFKVKFTCAEAEYEITDENELNPILNIILNEGKRFPNICVKYSKLDEWHDIILKAIETTENPSNILSNIDFKIHWDYYDMQPKKLSNRAKNIQRFTTKYKGEPHKVLKYEITNIHNSKVKFLISYWDRFDYDYIDRFQVERIK